MSGRWHLDLAGVGVVAAVAGWTVAVALARSIAVAAGSGSVILAAWLAARDEVPRTTVAVVGLSALAAAAGRFASAQRGDPRRLTVMLIAGTALVAAAVLAGRAWAASDHWALTFVGAGGTIAAVLVAVRGPVTGRRSPPDPWGVLGVVAAGALWLSAPDTELPVALGTLLAGVVVGHVFARNADRPLSGAAGWAATWSLIAVSAAGAFRGRPEGLGAGVVALVAAMAWPGWRVEPSPWPGTPAAVALAVTACGAAITARTTGLADDPGLHLAVALLTVVVILAPVVRHEQGVVDIGRSEAVRWSPGRTSKSAFGGRLARGAPGERSAASGPVELPPHEHTRGDDAALHLGDPARRRSERFRRASTGIARHDVRRAPSRASPWRGRACPLRRRRRRGARLSRRGRRRPRTRPLAHGRKVTRHDAQVQVLHLVASAQRRGAELFAVELARALGERGFPGRVVAMAGATAGAAIPSVDVLDEPYSPSGLRRLRRLARDADVLVGHGSRALVGGTMATIGTPVPFVYRSIGDPAVWGASSALRRLRVGLQLRRAAAVVALWPGAATAIERSFGVPPSRVRTIASATAAERFRQRTAQDRTAARGEFGIDGTRLVAAIIGSLSVEKRPELAIEGALSAGATVLVAGDGPLRAGLVRRWRDDDVRFLGVLDDVRRVLDAADVVVLSSRTEGLPGVLREGALTGLPLVATDVGGVNLIVDESTGRLVPADVTVEQLAAAITAVAADGDRLGAAARKRVLERFTIEPIADQWADLLGDVTGS